MKTPQLILATQLSLALILSYSLYQLSHYTPVASDTSFIGGTTEKKAAPHNQDTASAPAALSTQRPSSDQQASIAQMADAFAMQHSIILARPLFNSSRQPAATAETLFDEADETTDDWQSEWQLTGIVHSQKLQIALFGNAEEQRRLQPGMQLDGWQLSHIANDHVVLRQGKSLVELSLPEPRQQTDDS
ncbi:MAG: hypothetical protein OIF57_14115 [Marinobacterium sp.]|nr:hypothetical protein [Marinobacterium sp.]